MPKNLHRFLLDRIARYERPTFTGPELADFPEGEVSWWINSGTLKKLSAPETVRKQCPDGMVRSLEVYEHDGRFFGRCFDAGEMTEPVELSELDLSKYGFSKAALVREIGKANHFEPIFDFEGSQYSHIGDSDGSAVFLVQPVPPASSLPLVLSEIADSLCGQPGIIVFPKSANVSLSLRKRLAEWKLSLAFLGNNPQAPFSLATTQKQPEPDYSIEYTGKDWVFCFEGKLSRIDDSDQVRYNVWLLINQGEEISNVDLWKTLRPPPDPELFQKLKESGALKGVETNSVSSIKEAEVIVENADVAIEAAQSRGDFAKADFYSEEKAKAEEFLKAYRGKDGKPRRESDIYASAKTIISRARKRVRELLRETEYGGELAKHLEAYIVPGSPGHVVYNPYPRVDWVLKNIPKSLR